MTTSNQPRPVLLVRGPDGALLGACTSRCYDDQDFRCTCICGGVNHGVGYRTACGNAVDGIAIDWSKTHPKIAKAKCTTIVPRGVHRNADQLTLFDLLSPNAQEI